MDIILDMTKVFLSSVFFLSITDICCLGQFCFLCLCRVISLAYIFGKIAPVTSIVDEISL